jgi:hypothetical protein
MDFLRRHVRHALRQIRRQPAISFTVVLTLGLAIGANTAIFSFVNALLIRPFPFRDPDRLVEIQSVRSLYQIQLVEDWVRQLKPTSQWRFRARTAAWLRSWRSLAWWRILIDSMAIRPRWRVS